MKLFQEVLPFSFDYESPGFKFYHSTNTSMERKNLHSYLEFCAPSLPQIVVLNPDSQSFSAKTAISLKYIYDQAYLRFL